MTTVVYRFYTRTSSNNWICTAEFVEEIRWDQAGIQNVCGTFTFVTISAKYVRENNFWCEKFWACSTQSRNGSNRDNRRAPTLEETVQHARVADYIHRHGQNLCAHQFLDFLNFVLQTYISTPINFHTSIRNLECLSVPQNYSNQSRSRHIPVCTILLCSLMPYFKCGPLRSPYRPGLLTWPGPKFCSS